MERSQPSTSERDAPLLGIGKQCSHVNCLLVDFLPFKCHHCQQSFCQDHFKVEAHQCSQYDESKYNRVAPNCPMCNLPIAIKLGQDPNTRMEEHFSKDCTAMTGKSATKSMPTCARGNCKKVLYTPIKCDKCSKEFCASHRFPADHNCAAPTTNDSKPARLFASHPLVLKYSARSSVRAGAAASKSKSTTSSSHASSSKASTTSPSHASSSKATTTSLSHASSSKATTTSPSHTSSSKASTAPAPSILSPFNKTDRLSTGPSNSNATTSTTSDDTTAIAPDQCKPAPVNNPYIPRPLFSTA